MSAASQRHTTSLRAVEQLELPTAVRCSEAREVQFDYLVQRARECYTFGDAIEACAKCAGLCLDKQVSGPLGFDKAQLSRWESGQEGIKWHKLKRIMDWCGNTLPIIWLTIQGGFDPHSLRLAESEVERRARLEREQHDLARAKDAERIRELEIKCSAFLEIARAKSA